MGATRAPASRRHGGWVPGTGRHCYRGVESCGTKGPRMGLAAMLPRLAGSVSLPTPAPTPDRHRRQDCGAWWPRRLEQVTTLRRPALPSSTSVLRPTEGPWRNLGSPQPGAKGHLSKPGRLQVAGSPGASRGVAGEPPAAAPTWEGAPSLSHDTPQAAASLLSSACGGHGTTFWWRPAHPHGLADRWRVGEMERPWARAVVC